MKSAKKFMLLYLHCSKIYLEGFCTKYSGLYVVRSRSGSSLSTAAAVGSVAYPEMTERGYDKKMVVGSLAGGGTLGLLIPPSLSLLIYGH